MKVWKHGNNMSTSSSVKLDKSFWEAEQTTIEEDSIFHMINESITLLQELNSSIQSSMWPEKKQKVATVSKVSN